MRATTVRLKGARDKGLIRYDEKRVWMEGMADKRDGSLDGPPPWIGFRSVGGTAQKNGGQRYD